MSARKGGPLRAPLFRLPRGTASMSALAGVQPSVAHLLEIVGLANVLLSAADVSAASRLLADRDDGAVDRATVGSRKPSTAATRS